MDGLNSSVAIVAGELSLLKRLKSAPKSWRTRNLKNVDNCDWFCRMRFPVAYSHHNALFFLGV